MGERDLDGAELGPRISGISVDSDQRLLMWELPFFTLVCPSLQTPQRIGESWWGGWYQQYLGASPGLSAMNPGCRRALEGNIEMENLLSGPRGLPGGWRAGMILFHYKAVSPICGTIWAVWTYSAVNG